MLMGFVCSFSRSRPQPLSQTLRLVLLVLVFSGGCSVEDKPAGVLTKDQMVVMFREYYLREARLKEGRVTEDSAVILFTRFRQDALAHTGIPDSLVERSMHYYLARPAELNEIYDRLIDSLSLQEQRMKSGGTGQPRRAR